jgi:hypothetical protein
MAFISHNGICLALCGIPCAPPARLPRDVAAKPEGFPLGMPPDHHELPLLVARHHGFSRSTRKPLVFFGHVMRRVEVVGAWLRS